jgi:tetratricopeptide (TPR) repeat protein
MRRGMKKTIDAILRNVAVSSLFLVPMGFIISGSGLTNALDRVLRMKSDPRFSGGTELARFFDAAGDDRGEGALSYPKGPRFAAQGAFDLISYTVYAPELDAVWADERQFWQLSVKMAALPNPDDAPNGFSLCSIRIYVDTDGAKSGSLETAVPRAELASFDPSAPWDFMVEMDGWHKKALMRTADGRLKRRVTLIVQPERKTLLVRLPLDVPEIKRVLDGRATRHYVLVCGYDPSAPDGVMPVKSRPSSNAAGGARSGLTPRVFDILAASTRDQENQLSSYDEATFRYAALRPMSTDQATAGGRAPLNLEALEASARKQEEDARVRDREQAQKDAASPNPARAGGGLFRLGNIEAAESTLRKAATEDPKNAEALAYLGAISAMKAGSAGSVMEKVGLVNEGLALLERAYASAGTEEERETVLMSRAAIGSAIPEEVFSKNDAAGRDYLQLAEMSAARGDGRAAADRFISAGMCFERAGNRADADIAFARAASEQGLSARGRLELARRGYPLPPVGP